MKDKKQLEREKRHKEHWQNVKLGCIFFSVISGLGFMTAWNDVFTRWYDDLGNFALMSISTYLICLFFVAVTYKPLD